MQNKVGFIMMAACHWSMVLASYCAAVFEIVFPLTVLVSRWLEELQVVRQFQGEVANIKPVTWLTKKATNKTYKATGVSINRKTYNMFISMWKQ
jgi:hypothetical protein